MLILCFLILNFVFNEFHDAFKVVFLSSVKWGVITNVEIIVKAEITSRIRGMTDDRWVGVMKH